MLSYKEVPINKNWKHFQPLEQNFNCRSLGFTTFNPGKRHQMTLGFQNENFDFNYENVIKNLVEEKILELI